MRAALATGPKRGLSQGVSSLFFALAVSAMLAFCLLPVIWQLLTALKPTSELASLPPLFPSTPTLDHFRTVFAERPFARILLNSTVVAACTTVLCLALGTPAAFALAKLRVRGQRIFLLGTLAVSMFPPIAIVGALFLLIRTLHLRDTYWALVLSDTTFALPLAIWTLVSFFRDVPDDLVRAARVDGCTAFQILRHVCLPVIAPGLVTAALLTFVFTWNEFLFALTFTTTAAARTVPVEIALFPGLHEIPWGEIAAAAMMVTVPLLVLVGLLQRRIVAGLTAGAVKG
ncbi:MAG: carbohydrate ABC transporter permease [Deltaproteobacteria bacterium]|nr:carbohydrate ABC transporter permease [Deltaproteobacteria bacterium]